MAPDSFKGCLTALEVCDAVACGVRRACPEATVVKVPMADGGEGTVQALVDATGGELLTQPVEGPLGDEVQALFGVMGDGATGVIEMAAASGLPLVPQDRRNPLLTSTYGTGQLMRAALRRGCRRLIVGIGGSATTDGGAGMAQALGVAFLDASGEAIHRVAGGDLSRIAHVDTSGVDGRLKDVEIKVACDVDNPLYGPTGAAFIYGPQKGATAQMVSELDRGLRHYAAVLRADLGADVASVPGAGAAGGLGAGLLAFCNASLQRGVDIVLEAVGLVGHVAGADLVITGEGCIDGQTAFGKTPSGVARVAAAAGVPVVAVAGQVGPDARSLHAHGFTALHSIATGPMSLQEAMEPARAREMLRFAGEQILRTATIGAGRNRP